MQEEKSKYHRNGASLEYLGMNSVEENAAFE